MSITTKIFVEIQSETAIRHIATQYPYDTFNDDDLTLRGNTNEVSEELAQELQERLAVAGVEVIETRLNHWRMPLRSLVPCCSVSKPKQFYRHDKSLLKERSP